MLDKEKREWIMFGKEKNFILLLIVCFLVVLMWGSFKFGIDWMDKAWTPFLRTLIWPIILIIALLVFKPEFKGLITRMQTLKMNLPGGTTVDMTTYDPDDVKKLVEVASQAIPRARMTMESADITGEADFFGDPDHFQLLFKAGEKPKDEKTAPRWVKSTKAMEIPGVGCIVQVTTELTNPDGSKACAEALTFVEGVEVAEDEVTRKAYLGAPDRKKGRQLVKIGSKQQSETTKSEESDQQPPGQS
jgi:hypothetical protein